MRGTWKVRERDVGSAGAHGAQRSGENREETASGVQMQSFSQGGAGSSDGKAWWGT